MEPLKDWFTNDTLGQFTTALVALRLIVEVTKKMFDKGWMLATGYKPYTFFYAMAWAVFIIFFIKGGEWQANVLNIFALLAMSKAMDMDEGK